MNANYYRLAEIKIIMLPIILSLKFKEGRHSM